MPPVQVYVVGRVHRRQAGYIAWSVLIVTPNEAEAIAACTQNNDFYAAVMTETLFGINEPPIPGGIFPNQGP